MPTAIAGFLVGTVHPTNFAYVEKQPVKRTETWRRRIVARTLDLHVFIDALGWPILRRQPFLADLLPHRRALRTVLGYSCAAVPSLLTGCTPAEHGRLSFYYYAPQESPFRRVGRLLRLVPSPLANRGRVRRYLSRYVARRLGLTGYFQLYNVPLKHLAKFATCETVDIFGPGGLSPCRSIFDRLREGEIRFHCSDWRRDEVSNLSAALKAVGRAETEWAFVYLPGLDGLMHAVGTRHLAVSQRLEFYEGWIRRLYDKACRRHDHVRLTVMSDHGMTDVTRQCDVEGVVEGLGLVFGEDYVAFYDSTMARFWYLRDGVRGKIERCLRQLSYGTVLDRERLGQFGADFSGDRFGETVFLIDPGWLIVPSFMGRTGLAAMHGYSPDDPGADAIVACSEPLGSELHSITDLFGHLGSVLERNGGLKVPDLCGIGSADERSPRALAHARR